MGLNFTLKDTKEEDYLIRSRIHVTAIIILLSMLILTARLFYLQVIRHNHFVTLSQSNRIKLVPVAPSRGLIFSRDNVLVADNQLSFSLELVPELVEDSDKDIAQLAQLIDIDADNIRRFKKLQQDKRQFESIPLKLYLSESEVARFFVASHNFFGIDVVARPYRHYPQRTDLVHVLGYVGRIDKQDLLQLDRSNYSATNHIGKSGVEKQYEQILHGHVGHQQVEVDVQGRVVRVLNRTAPIAGHNIYLTIDFSLQTVATQLLQGKKGAIVAIDPNNGDILTLVSAPAYDPNVFVNNIGSKSSVALLNNQEKPLINRALHGTYYPGSTIKPFIALAALKFSVRGRQDTTRCKGWYSLPNNKHRYRDWKEEGHGAVNLNQAIIQSCNVYFYSLAHDLGITRLSDTLKTLGFGAKTGIDIGGEVSGLVPSIKWKDDKWQQPWYPGETLITGIGQGYLSVTPLQLAVATAQIANHGKNIIPRLVYKISDPISGKEGVLPVQPVAQTLDYEPQHWDYIIQAMEGVVHNAKGTARRSGANAAYTFAGKTGTAQVSSIGQDEKYDKDKIPIHLRDHALFIAFAPVNDPKIALAIVIENGGSGSSTAAPIARQLFDQYLLNESGELK